VTPAPLSQAGDAQRFGGKAAALARALGAGLPVPPGWALDHHLVDALAAGSAAAAQALRACLAGVSAPLAVRSSAVGEDGGAHSFAGQHLTRLGVAAADVAAAVIAVRSSVHAPAALAYRARRDIAGPPRAGAVIQELVAAEVAAVVFTRDPVRGDDTILIEASVGLGESVVGGAVVPDRFVLDRGGRVLSRQAGDKDSALVWRDGRVTEITVDGPARAALCLDDAQLARIHQLVIEVDRVWPGPHDLEIAFRGREQLYLLQRRPLTTG
jgi:pyruvate, water dikinase